MSMQTNFDTFSAYFMGQATPDQVVEAMRGVADRAWHNNVREVYDLAAAAITCFEVVSQCPDSTVAERFDDVIAQLNEAWENGDLEILKI